MRTLESYISGSWQAASEDLSTLVNPSNGEAIAQTGTRGLDLRAALEHARDVGGPTLRAMSFAERGALLKTMSKSLHAVRDALIEASMINAGTTRSDSKFDIDGATGTLAYYASLGKRLGDRSYVIEGEGEQLTQSARFWGHHVRVPLRGAAVHINAFNFPAWGLAEKAAVAILAGMPVVSKPATSTSLVAHEMMRRLTDEKVLPDGVLQFVCGSAGDMLEHLAAQDVLAFTGSGSTGTLLRSLRNVVGRSVRVNVEADSLNAAVLGPDVEPGSDTYQMFIRDCTKEITQKTGQKCTATRRIFIAEGMLDRVRDDLAENLDTIKVGDPTAEGVRMGPLATGQQLRDVRQGIARLVEAGAEIVYGSSTEVDRIGGSDAGFFIGPVLLRADSPRDVGAVHEHEVFGPVATVMPYRSPEDAAELVALGEGGLVSSVYSDDREVLKTLIVGLGPYNGRILVGSKKIADQAISPGLVLPSCVHGGPGRAGGGEELGGERGLAFYTQRTAVQGDRALLDKLL
ncbi:MAG: 3,4-dehydroadipyl-CoA semialdehyde dehydrogenase [Myxococcota bacterium]